MSIIQFESDRKRSPTSYTTDVKGRPLLSWRVRILPYLGEEKLYQEFHLHEPWDSPHNFALIPKMPAVYANPGVSVPPGNTCWFAVVGEDSVIVEPMNPKAGKDGNGIKNSDVMDGTSKTILLVEVDPDVAAPWTSPRDYAYDLNQPRRHLGRARPDGSFFAAWADGHVSNISPAMSDEPLQNTYQRSNATRKAFEDDPEE